MQFVDQACAEILADRGHTSAEAHIAVTCCGLRSFQRCVNSFGDEVEHGSARHRQWCSRILRQYEDGRVVRRLVAPPASPAVIRPWAANGPEHVAPENPGTDSVESLLRKTVVDSGLAIVVAVHPPPCARRQEPLHQLGSSDAERVLEILVRSRAVAVDRYCETLHS